MPANLARMLLVFSTAAVAVILLLVFGLATTAYLYPNSISTPRASALATGLVALALLLSYVSQFTGVTVADFFRKPKEHPVLTGELAMTPGGSIGMVAFILKLKNLGSAHAKNIEGRISQNPAEPSILAGSSLKLAGLAPDPAATATMYVVEATDFPGLNLDTIIQVEITYDDYHDRKYDLTVSSTLRALEERFTRDEMLR